MKLNKIFAFGLLAFALTACSDDDDAKFNSASDVTVSMQQTEISVTKKFTGVYYNVPVIVTGDANGPIKVTVEVSAASDLPATEGEDFRITSKTIIIPADSKIGNIQFYPIGSDDETNSAEFIVTITSAEGAQIGTQKTTEVTLKVPTIYEKLQGAWIWQGADFWDAYTEQFNLTCTGLSEGDTGYGVELYFSGFMGYNWVILSAEYLVDEETGLSTLSFPLGQVIAEGVNFGSAGVRDVGLAGISGSSLLASGSVDGQVSPDLQSVTFDPNDGFFGSLMNNGALTASLWFGYTDMSMAKK